MEELVTALKILLANQTFMYYKTHSYHWNIEGIEFSQYHDFFGELYTDIYASTDPTAENIRKLDAYAPFKLSRFIELNEVGEPDVTSDPMMMSADLLMANDMVLTKLVDACDMATANRQHALANFFAERMDMHQRWHWMLTVSLKNIGTD